MLPSMYITSLVHLLTDSPGQIFYTFLSIFKFPSSLPAFSPSMLIWLPATLNKQKQTCNSLQIFTEYPLYIRHYSGYLAYISDQERPSPYTGEIDALMIDHGWRGTCCVPDTKRPCEVPLLLYHFTDEKTEAGRKKLAQGHTDGEWWSGDLNPTSLEVTHLTIALFCVDRMMLIHMHYTLPVHSSSPVPISSAILPTTEDESPLLLSKTSPSFHALPPTEGYYSRDPPLHHCLHSWLDPPSTNMLDFL